MVVSIKVEDLLPLQFSNRKAEYIVEIAKQFVAGNISEEILSNQTTEEAVQTLVKI